MNFKNGCLMKKNLFKVLFVAAATTVLFACTKEPETEPAIIRTVEFAAGPISKTIFGTPEDGEIPTLWTANKTVGISLNLASTKQSSTPEVSGGGATATFRADIEDSGSGPYTFYAVSPYSSVVSVNVSYKSIQVEIPASQTPLPTSVDEGAQILVAKYPAGDSFPASAVAMNFAHLTAYGKISFTNLSLASGEEIASVSLTAAENWAGRYYYYAEDYDTYSEGDIVANSAGKTITLSTTSDTNIWFACAPVNLRNTQLKVVIATDQGNTYTKRITLPDNEKYTFESGKVTAFKVNMDGIGPDGPVQYDLVTNAAELTVGSQVIIAAPGTTAIAMSTTQNGNNRGQASVTKTTGGSAITSPGDAVQILTIEAGKQENTIAFYTGEGYLYAASSGSNWLRTEETLSDNSSWTVTIDAESGEATVLAQGTYTRNKMRYNSGSSIFACYASDSSTGTPVSFYILAADWVLDNIAVTTAPDKTTYEAGENFDPTGMVVTAHYVDADDSEHTKDVVIANSDLTFDPATNLEAGTTSVTISYGGKETTQEITVTAPKVWDLQSIAVTTAPGKTTYTEGDFFDPDGLVVTATFEERGNTSNTKEEVVENDDLDFDPALDEALETTDASVTISYTVSGITKTATQEITVNPASATVYYEKVTSAPSNWAGDYLIVYEASSTSGEVLTGVSSNIGQHTTVVISDSKIVADDYDDYNVSIEQSGGSYTMKLGTKYLAYTSTATSSNNYLYAVDDASTNGTLWTLSVDDARNVYNTSRYLRYNTGSPRFCCYTSGQAKIAFYKLNDNTVWDLKSIAVTTPPTKTAYEAGEYFDPTGMVVTATYEDHDGVKADKTETVAHGDLTFSPTLTTALTAGTTSVSITYEGQSTSQAITVSAPITWDLKSIAVTTAPTTTTYNEGDYFNPAGMVVTATFENHDNTAQTKQETVDNANLTFTPSTSTALTTANTSVTISYTVSGITKSTTQAITVNSGGGDVPTEKEYYKLNTTSTPVGTSNSYGAYTDISCANNLSSYGTYPSTATWSTTCGSKQSNTSFWWGSNSKQSAKMTLGNGSVSGASAIATALGVTTSATYYTALICSTNFANISKVVMTRTTPGGTAPSNVYLLYTTNNGTSYTLADTKTDGATITFTIASPVASAKYAIVIKCSGYCQYKDPIITFYTTD